MEHLIFESSNLESGRYDAKNEKLYITFKKNKVTYLYTKVPLAVKEELMADKSPGSYFRNNIVGRFNYQKV